jgi:UDP-N-acetylglucosamine--N-acetylmuramyl-(pentapeptide) pyrophosphoryl-undecaprenol N-acetylglucosamine transferase
LTAEIELSRTRATAPSAICWVGSKDGVERGLVERAGIPFEGISAEGLRGRGPSGVARGLAALARGFLQARHVVARFRPDVVFVTGGYVCGPVVLAAWFARVPVLIYLPDVEPGLAVRVLARLAVRVAVTTPASVRFFRPGQAVVTGYPVRPSLCEVGWDRSAARQRLHLAAGAGRGGDRPVLLVFGGSQGAHSINQAICEGIVTLLTQAEVIHLTGRRDAAWVQTQRFSLPEAAQAFYHVYDYLDEDMMDALMVADLAVARAGASTLGELPAAGLPAVLVPYPHAGAHQLPNARFLADAGAAVIVPDDQLGSRLVPTVVDLLADGNARETMRRAARTLAQPGAAGKIAGLLRELSS